MVNKKRYIEINSVSELHRMMGLQKPLHPLISLVKMDEIVRSHHQEEVHFILNFYGISLKKNLKGKLKYGQNYYDFDEGVLGMTAPQQILSVSNEDNYEVSGWWLVFHNDFILNYQLGRIIKDYGFFSYSINEALHLSDKEEKMLETIFKNIELEYQTSIDQFSQDVMVSQLELLLNYCNRFYNRQFITRKKASTDILTKMEIILDEYLNSNKLIEQGLPSVQYFSEQLNVSSNYLSDMLKTLTGQSTQQHIHNKIIEQAKLKLTNTNLTVSEIAYQLGFEHSQSFSKLFKNKTNLTPIEFRASFN
jgi:AraC-like DNA-binding protein